MSYPPATIVTVHRREPNGTLPDHDIWDDYILTFGDGTSLVLPHGSDRYMALTAVLDNESFTYDPSASS